VLLVKAKRRNRPCKGQPLEQPAYATPLTVHRIENSTDEKPRIILDAATRRFQAHKIYLRAAAATRWAQMRQQVLRGEKPNGRHANALRAIDARLREASNYPSHLLAQLHAHAMDPQGLKVAEDQ